MFAFTRGPSPRSRQFDSCQHSPVNSTAELRKMAHTPRREQLSTEQQLAELVDEVVFLNKQADQWAACCEALLDYTVLLEKHVVLPAFGQLASLLEEYHAVADARARGETVLGATVNAASHPQLAKLFAQMSRPSRATLDEAARQEAISGPPPTNVDDAYIALRTLIQRKDRLLDAIGEAHSAAAGVAKVATSPSPPPAGHSPSDIIGLRRQLADLRNERDALRRDMEHGGGSRSPSAQSATARYEQGTSSKVQNYGTDTEPSPLIASLREQLRLVEQRNASQAQLAKQEADVAASRVDVLNRQNMDLDRQVTELRAKLRSTQHADELYQQAANERALLQDRVKALEAIVKQNEADRAAVAESFEVLQNALEATGNPLALQQAAATHSQRTRVLETEVRTLREAVSEHKRELEEQRAQHDSAVRDLRKKLVYAQQQAQTAKNSGSGGGTATSLLQEIINSAGLASRSGSAFGGGSRRAEDLSALVNDSRGAVGADRSPNDGGLSKAKLRAFEMTISALNAELAQVEEKILEADAKHSDERARLERQLSAERERFEGEQVECDNVLAQVSSELEQCMKENAELRARLQTQYQSHSRRR
jgi:DNA repair exonuclease SbcCD ATPase subunit